jgi:hypothetical protein
MAEKSPAVLLREALDNLELPTTPSEIVRWVRKKHPHMDEGKIRSQVTICCVNMPTRVSFPENQAPRIANDPALDCLFRVDFGQYVKYDPSLHEQWEIADVNGELIVRKVVAQETPVEVAVAAADTPTEAVPPETAEAQELKIHGKARRMNADEMKPETAAQSEPEPAPIHEPEPIPVVPESPAFVADTAPQKVSDTDLPEGDADMKPEQAVQLHEILVDRLQEVEDGLRSHPEPGIAANFPIPLASSDILAEGGGGSVVIVKVFSQPPSSQFVTELLVNMGWAHENMPGREVRAIALMPSVPDELRFAAKTVPGIKLATYEYKLVFTPVK